MHELYHDWFHIVDDHNELRQGEASMADAWGTHDWAERHFAEGLGLWEVNVFKASVYFQHKTWNHNEFRKLLAHAFLTLGKHEYGTPIEPEAAAATPAQTTPPDTLKPHICKTFEALGCGRAAKKVCGYCGCSAAYLCCSTCCPKPTADGVYGICNPATGRDCFSKHCQGMQPSHTGYTQQKNKRKAPAYDLRDSPSSKAKKRVNKKSATKGGKASGASRKAKKAA